MTVETLFAWIGALVVNIAFISSILWGTATDWALAFGVSILYTVLLFGLAVFLDRYGSYLLVFGFRNSREVEDIDRYNEENNADEDNQSTRHRFSFLASILYGLAVLAMGVTMFFLPTNLTPCERYSYGEQEDSTGGAWQTNYSALPNDVKQWALSTSWEPPRYPNTYVQLKTGITLFRGNDDGETESKLLVAAGGKVTSIDYVQPQEFNAVSDSLACFTSSACDVCGEKNPGVGCSDGTVLRVDKSNRGSPTTMLPFHLKVFNNTLWFKDADALSPYPEPIHMIYSLDPTTMQATLHSTYNDTKGTNSDFELYGSCRRKQASFTLWVAALPVLVVSVWLWYVRGDDIATMSGTTWAGLTAVALCVGCIIAPYIAVFDMWKWWGSIGGALWLALLVNWSIVRGNTTNNNSNSRGSSPSISWGLQIGGMSYFMAMIFALNLFYDANSHPLQWIVMNAAVVAPLGLLGVAMEVTPLLVLSAIGLFLDSCQVAIRLADLFPGSEPIFFLLIGFCGIGIAMGGWFLQHHLGSLRDRLRLGLEQYAWNPQEVEGLVVASNDDGEQAESGSYDLTLHEHGPDNTMPTP